MPFVSEAQRRFLYSQHPDIAKRWAKETPKGKKLPKRKRKGAHLSRKSGKRMKRGRKGGRR